jgi:hypothetical protein
MNVKHDYTHPLAIITLELDPGEHNGVLNMLRYFISVPYGARSRFEELRIAVTTATQLLQALEKS